MTELFLVNYAHEDGKKWECYKSTHSLMVAWMKANKLRDKGYRVTVQSVLINDNGKVEL
jgi:hypothetical protein